MKDFLKKLKGPLIILVIIAAIVGSISGIVHGIHGMKLNISAHTVKSFWSIYSDLNYVSDDLLELFKEKNQGNSELLAIHAAWLQNDRLLIQCIFEDESENYSEKITCSEKEVESLAKIWKAFAGHNYGSLGAITVRKNLVAFRREGQYSLVYSKSWTPPKYILNEETDDIYSRRIAFGWFHCMFEEHY